MINVQIDAAQVQDLCKQKIAELIKDADADLVFWDSSELKKRTCMSWNFIQENFFFDPRFPKHKVGSKWYFPAKEARTFLENWLQERQG